MAVKRETRVLIAGAVVISLLICVLGLRQELALWTYRHPRRR